MTQSDEREKEAFRAMAGEAAKWLLKPQEMEASAAAVSDRVMEKGREKSKALTASEIFDQAMLLLLPVRQQADQGAIDYRAARQRLTSAEGLIAQLPESTVLRNDLQSVVDDLRRSVPGA